VFLDNWFAQEYYFCMSRDLATIADEALKLPQNEQLKLARTLLEKNEASGDQEADAAWEQEIERRIQLIDAGLAKGRPFSDVLRDIDRQLGK
jgi:predicted GTPase